jgi:hypothetical protein
MSKASNPGIYALILLIALVGLAYLGGLPAPEEIPFFILGSVILIGLSLAIGALGWYLLYRPLPDNHKISPSPISSFQRQILATALIISMVLVGLGGAWDEVWHSLYGIPFGEDFLWRPHQLIYAGFVGIIVLAAFSFFQLVFKAKGSFTQRFRSDKYLAYVVLVGLFMAYALPADPLWHTIYGDDISSFSIPHVLLTLLFVFPLLIGSGLIISSTAKRTWQSILHLRWLDALPILAFVFMQLIFNMLFAANWELLTLQNNSPLGTITAIVPEWLFPLLLVFVASFVGIIANHSLRYFGAATLIGLLSFCVRLLLLRLLGHELLNAPAWLVALSVQLSIDIFYAIFLRRGNAPNWWQAGSAAGLGMAFFGFALINWLYPVPEITFSNLPFMLIAVFAGALLAAWFAQALGDSLADTPRYAIDESSNPKWQLAGMTAFVFAVTTVFFFWFVLTATSPML